MQPPVKLRNSKLCSVISLTVIEYSGDSKGSEVGLSLCLSHIPHCWISHDTAHMFLCFRVLLGIWIPVRIPYSSIHLIFRLTVEFGLSSNTWNQVAYITFIQTRSDKHYSYMRRTNNSFHCDWTGTLSISFSKQLMKPVQKQSRLEMDFG